MTLAGYIVNKKVCFLCGAGMSKASGLPLADDLCAMMIGELLDGVRPKTPYHQNLVDLARIYPVESIAETYLNKFDKPKFTDLVKEELSRGSGTIHDGHRALEYLASEGFIDRVYTTNFDTLIEEAFGARTATITDVNIDEIHKAWNNREVPVLHLHGYINSECLLAESETYHLDTPLASFLMADMVTNWFVWVGYSLTDLDLRTIYFSMRDKLRKKGLAKRPFVVLPLTDGTDDQQKQECRLADWVWQIRYATFIPGKAEIFLPALVAQVCRTHADGLAERIIEKRGGNPRNQTELDSLWKEAETMATSTRMGNELDAMKLIAHAEGII